MTPGPVRERLHQAMDAYQRATERSLDEFMPRAGTDPPVIHEAMRYSVFGKAKRLRPVLAMLVASALGSDPWKVGRIAGALELIHTYSLIHDDLPCMDDDDLRRGLPTCHVRFGEAIAVLAGDALLTMAFELILENGRHEGYPPGILLAVVEELSRAAGSQGVIAGQVHDLAAEGRDIDRGELEKIHRLKTGRLFLASIRLGALLAAASSSQAEALDAYGDHFGAVFQIVDDILDVTGNTEEMGKPVGSDEKNDKATYPRLLGMDEAWSEARRHAREAKAALASGELDASLLDELVDWVLERRA